MKPKADNLTRALRVIMYREYYTFIIVSRPEALDLLGEMHYSIRDVIHNSLPDATEDI